MLKITVQKLGDARVLRCEGQIVVGDACSILRNAILSQRHTRRLVLDLASVDRIDAGGLGALLDMREWARSYACVFKLMNVTKKVEEILELTHLQSVFEFCSVRDFFCLLHRAASMPSWSSDQSHGADEYDGCNCSVKWQEAGPFRGNLSLRTIKAGMKNNPMPVSAPSCEEEAQIAASFDG